MSAELSAAHFLVSALKVCPKHTFSISGQNKRSHPRTEPGGVRLRRRPGGRHRHEHRHHQGGLQRQRAARALSMRPKNSNGTRPTTQPRSEAK